MSIRVLAFAGSARAGSFNKKLVKIGAEGARSAGGDVTLLDLADYEVAVYNADREKSEGMPAKIEELQELFFSHDALLISTPENNGFFTALLKNTLDWVSRPSTKTGRSGLTAFEGKPAALLSASPSGFGAIRSIGQTRTLLGILGCVVIPKQTMVSRAGDAFAEDGALKDARAQEGAIAVGKALVDFAAKMKG